MSRIGTNIVIGTFWIAAAVWMFTSGGADNQASAGILVILGLMFYWAAFKMYQNPNLAKTNKKNLVQKLSDKNYMNSINQKKK